MARAETQTGPAIAGLRLLGVIAALAPAPAYAGAWVAPEGGQEIWTSVAGERDGLSFASALDYCPELLVKPGVLTRRQPTAAQSKDIEFGWMMAKEMGRLDVGQSVAVKECATLAIEAIEGTDRCIERAGTLCRAGGWTLVKVAKPQQDMRFDVPTIGLGTLETMVTAGGRVLAVEAGRTIIIDQPHVIEYANRHKLAIVALDADGRPKA